MAKKSAVERNLKRQRLVSRIALRQLASHGLIPGVVKSSW